jgi:predicted TIM-barrel enzyme
MAGRGSLAGLMPYSDANAVVVEMVVLLHISYKSSSYVYIYIYI